jgi:hypothetical protein
MKGDGFVALNNPKLRYYLVVALNNPKVRYYLVCSRSVSCFLFRVEGILENK